MENQRRVGHVVVDLFEAFKIDPNCAFVKTMRRADGNSQGVNFSFVHKGRCIFRPGENVSAGSAARSLFCPTWPSSPSTETPAECAKSVTRRVIEQLSVERQF